LLRDTESEWILGSDKAYEDFAPLRTELPHGLRLYYREGHLTPAPIASSWQVGGEWVTAIPTISEFQAVIDETIGPGLITLDPIAYSQTAIHEMFHVFQLTRVGGPQGFPEFVLAGNDAAALQEIRQSPQWQDELQRECDVLALALQSASQEDVRAAIRRYVDMNAARLEGYSEDLRIYESNIKWVEGTARFADISLSQEHARILSGLSEGSSGEEALFLEANLIQCLEDISTITSGVRDAYALIGAAEAFALQAIDSNWQESFFDSGLPLTVQLKRALTES
jgi:hypothetical protein